MTETTQTPDFEKALTELQVFVKELESGKLPLEESLKKFEQGMKLLESCQKYLTEAESRIEKLTQSDPKNQTAH